MSTDRLTLAKPPRSKPAVRKAPFDFARAIAALFILGITACVLAPIVNLARIALSGGGAFWGGFAANVLPNALLQTSLLLFGVAALAGLIGIASAWLVTVYRFPLRGALVWLLPLPLAIPTYIAAYVYVDLFATIAPAPDIRSLGGAVFIFGLVLYPYVYIAARAMFQTQSACLIEVARTLGASRFGLVRHIAVPLARPALAVGLSLVLLETLNDIGASEYLGVPTLTLSVFTTWLNRGDLPGAAQLSMVMLVFVSACVAIEQAARRNRRFGISIQRPRMVSPIVLRGGARFAAALACFAPVVLGFVIPILYLAHQVIVRGLLVGFDPALIRHTLTTVALAAIATLVALAIGAGLALAVRAIKHRFFTNCLIVAGLGYAIPGTVLALALLGPLVSMDEGINVVWRGLTGVTLGLVIAGSGTAIVIAYVIRFLTISIGSAHAGLTRVSTHIDDVARTLGAPVSEVTWRIHLPLLRPAIGGAALLIFVDCLKELPATLLLRPLNVETLSTYIYQFAARGTFEEGALAALLIVAVGVLPVIWMTRYAEVRPAS